MTNMGEINDVLSEFGRVSARIEKLLVASAATSAGFDAWKATLEAQKALAYKVAAKVHEAVQNAEEIEDVDVWDVGDWFSVVMPAVVEATPGPGAEGYVAKLARENGLEAPIRPDSENEHSAPRADDDAGAEGHVAKLAREAGIEAPVIHDNNEYSSPRSDDDVGHDDFLARVALVENLIKREQDAPLLSPYGLARAIIISLDAKSGTSATTEGTLDAAWAIVEGVIRDHGENGAKYPATLTGTIVVALDKAGFAVRSSAPSQGDAT